jgi:hypothetical protein
VGTKCDAVVEMSFIPMRDSGICWAIKIRNCLPNKPIAACHALFYTSRFVNIFICKTIWTSFRFFIPIFSLTEKSCQLQLLSQEAALQGDSSAFILSEQATNELCSLVLAVRT